MFASGMGSRTRFGLMWGAGLGLVLKDSKARFYFDWQ